ncbi:MAG: M20/M25/M40 family metallo-hydrolase [Acidobacteriota bacterium]|nr:M20/M25/M40 family metallo-hydrolase [Acidobacteriota bacterium]
MRYRPILALALLSATVVSAQQPAQPLGAITEASVRGHMEFLASDAMNGRGSGTRDEWIATEYIAAQLRRWGLEPLGDGQTFGPADPARPRSFVQTIEMRTVETTAPPVLTAGSLRLAHGKEMLVQTLGSIAEVRGRFHRYVPGQAVPTGSIVLMPSAPAATSPAEMTAARRDAIMAERTATLAASVIVVPETATVRAGWDAAAAKLPSGPARAVGLSAMAAPRPTRIVANAASYAALSKLADGAMMHFAADTKWGDTPSYTWNAVGELTGSDDTMARQVILLSAHLDHVGARTAKEGEKTTDLINNGADDDASGTVAVMELARAIAAGPRPKRTIVFAFFGSEERGGHGSNYFAESPTITLSRIVANLQFEMIGRPDPKVPAKTLWLTGYERSNLGAELAKRGARLVQDPHPDQSFFTRSDNIRFARKGIPAHTVSSFGLHTDYHQPGDEVWKIDFPHMTEAIRSMLEPIRWLANDTFRPEWAPNGRPR